MTYEYKGYTVDVPLLLYLEGTEEQIESYILDQITSCDYSHDINENQEED